MAATRTSWFRCLVQSPTNPSKFQSFFYSPTSFAAMFIVISTEITSTTGAVPTVSTNSTKSSP